MVKIDNNVIVLGDLHFGVKRFNIGIFNTQIELFQKQIIPYMKENNINYIIQLGDFFDNRSSMDIIFFNKLRKEFFNMLVKENIQIITLLGNHDIALRESLEYSIIKSFEDMYPNNFKCFDKKTEIAINNKKCFIVPWLTKKDKLTFQEIKDYDNVFGHFEIRNFEVIKGVKDESSILTEDFFLKGTKIQNVLSGHYHLKNTKGVIKYLGTPWQINWNDYNEEKGFYEFDGVDLKFIENNTTPRFIKIFYKDKIIIKGLGKNIIINELQDFKKINISKHIIKFYIDKNTPNEYLNLVAYLKQNNYNFTLIDNRLNNIEINEEDITNIENTKDVIIESIKKNNKNLLPKLIKLYEEIKDENI